MTPLAHRIVKELTLPERHRTFKDFANLTERMSDVHCFEVSQVWDMAADLAESSGNLSDVLTKFSCFAFLPAPRTWIEFKRSSGLREGVLLEEVENGEMAWCTWAAGSETVFCTQPKGHKFAIGLRGEVWRMKAANIIAVARQLNGETSEQAAGWTTLLYALLAIINTPRIVGRRQYLPHRALQRELLSKAHIAGHFPLHAWNEITLEVTPPKEHAAEHEFEAHLTGRRALHFVRSHLRVSDGRLSFVKAHWRGDASLGIKQQKYKVVPPRGSA